MKRFFLYTVVIISTFCTIDLKASDKDMNIVIAGDSTVWGAGLLGEYSFVSCIDDFLKTEYCELRMPEQMIFKNSSGESIRPDYYTNRKQYRKRSAIIKGMNASVEFDINGTEINICQTIRRSKNWAKMDVFADQEYIGSFNNKNAEEGYTELTFKGDGKTNIFELKRPFTYNHSIKINEVLLKGGLNTASYMTSSPFIIFKDYDYLIIKKFSSTDTIVHAVLFKIAPPAGSSVNISFQYGETVAYTACHSGELADDSELESLYGSDKVTYDPANSSFISSGLEFRYINEKAFFRHRFDSPKKRHIKIVIREGKDPYFSVNFAVNRFYNLMNAGIGGWTAERFLNDSHRSWKKIISVYSPDLLFIALGPNDDWQEGERFTSRKIIDISEEDLRYIPSLELSSATLQKNGLFTIEKKSAIVDSIDAYSLKSDALKGNTKIKKGYFVRIGSYTGDNDSVAIRQISSFESEKGVIIWKKELTPMEVFCKSSFEELKGTEFSVRSLEKFKANLMTFSQNIKEKSPSVKIFFLNVVNPNYFMRDMWGYYEAMQEVAQVLDNVEVLDVAKKLQEAQRDAISGKNRVHFKAGNLMEYTLPWTGHAQGFKVIIDGKDVYGRNCYILSGAFYAIRPDSSGGALEFNSNSYFRPHARTEKMKLVFLRKPPPGTEIVVEKSDICWSSDFTHPNQIGIDIAGRMIIEKLKELILPPTRHPIQLRSSPETGRLE